MRLCIRQARADELGRVNRFYKRAGHRGRATAQDLTFIALEDERLLAAARLCPERGVLLLRSVWVWPAQRGAGIGRRLLRRVLAQLPPQPCYCLPYSHLIAFYASLGFVEIAPAQAPEFLAARYARYRRRGEALGLMRFVPTASLAELG